MSPGARVVARGGATSAACLDSLEKTRLKSRAHEIYGENVLQASTVPCSMPRRNQETRCCEDP